LNGRYGRLCSILKPETLEDDVDVPLDGTFRESKRFGNSLIAQPFHNQAEDFTLLRRQIRVRSARRLQPLNVRGDHPKSGMHTAHSVSQLRTGYGL
jgi:hypothetical protein